VNVELDQNHASDCESKNKYTGIFLPICKAHITIQKLLAHGLEDYMELVIIWRERGCEQTREPSLWVATRESRMEKTTKRTDCTKPLTLTWENMLW
jgi:hypothetical protein